MESVWSGDGVAGDKSAVRWKRVGTARERTTCERTAHGGRARPRSGSPHEGTGRGTAARPTPACTEHEHLTALGEAAAAVMESAPGVAACWLRAALNTFPPEQRGGREHTRLLGLLERALTLSGDRRPP
ncbi:MULTISPECIES: hypothetical protein [Streptosporangium]|uniref:Uncharacterized protein n=1 Tax=Streptosporangium jomthongense TaxID=1193683 RepID=A0ABV8EX89_9ACTN